MAFGTRKGGLSGNLAAITNPTDATGSVAVVVGDLILGVICEQTNLTSVTPVTDNLGNTYTNFSAGSIGGAAVSVRCWYSRVTVAGTLTTVHFPATASADAVVVLADVFNGPFRVSPLDAHPAQNVDTTSPFTSAATGTLAYRVELIACWAAQTGAAGFSATSPNTIGGKASSGTTIGLQIGSQVVAVTTTVSPAWTGTNPTADVLGTGSFFAEDQPANLAFIDPGGDPTDEPIFDDGLWQSGPADAVAVATGVLQYNFSFFDLADLVTEPFALSHLTEATVAAAPDLIESVLSEDDFEPETGLDLSQSSPAETDNLVTDGIVPVDAQDDFEPETGLDLVQASPAETDNLVTDGIVQAEAQDDFEAETGLDLVQEGTPDVVLAAASDLIESFLSEDDFVAEEGTDLTQANLTEDAPVAAPDLIESFLSEDDFVAEEGIDLTQANLTEAAPVIIPDLIESFLSEDDFVAEEGTDLTQANLTEAAPLAAPDLIESFLGQDDFEDDTGLDLVQSNLTEDIAVVVATTDVIQYSFSFFDLADLVTEPLQQSHLTEDPPLFSFDGPLVDVLFDIEQRIDTSIAQPSLTEPFVAPPASPDVVQYNFSFFDLTDLVTEPLSQSHLTEAAAATFFGPDIVNVEAQDDFEPETGLDLAQATPTDAAAAFVSDATEVTAVDAVDDFEAETGLDLSQSSPAETDNLVTDEIVSVASEDDFEAETGLDLVQSSPAETDNLVTDGIVSVAAEDDFEPEFGIDQILATAPDDAIIVPLAPEIVALDADDDFQPEEGVDIVLALPPDDAPPTFFGPDITNVEAQDDFEDEPGIDFYLAVPPDDAPPFVPPAPVTGGRNIGWGNLRGYICKPRKKDLKAAWTAQRELAARAAKLKDDAKRTALQEASRAAAAVLREARYAALVEANDLSRLTAALKGGTAAARTSAAFDHAERIEDAARLFRAHMEAMTAQDEDEATCMLLL